jgi:NDP-mannose synthase
MSKRAILLAGGKGTRLKPYTISLPKPLVPVGGMPVVEIIIKQLAKQGFGHITITVNHMADIIKAFCGDGAKWGVKIDYIIEDKPLSTMGPLKLINDLPVNFLVMNGDVISDIDLCKFYEDHAGQNSLFTIAAYNRVQKVDYGVLDVENNKLEGFQEKPSLNYKVSMGIYMVNRSVVSLIPENTFFGFDHLMYEMIKNNKPVDVNIHEGYWLDIGRPDDYEQAVNDLEEGLFKI